jgi:hypothetical protein
MLRSMMSRLLPPLGFTLALLCTPHCAQEQGQDPIESNAAETVQDGVILSAATWTLGWNTADVEFDASGGFSLTTNLGYRVHIETGHLVLHRVALIPCPVTPTNTAAFVSFSIAAALAHEEDSDPSSMETLAISDVVHSKATEIGANAFAPVRYCQVYWLVARGMEGALAADGLDMSNRSMYFEGTWERNGDSGPVFVDTWWPTGVITDMKSIVEPQMYATASAESNVHFTWIGIDLALGKLFDDIEFAADSDAIITDSILDNVLANAELTVDLQSL